MSMTKRIRTPIYPLLLLATLSIVPLVSEADTEHYTNQGIFGQIEYQGLKLTVAETAQVGIPRKAVGPAADFFMADGCLFATGHTDTPIQYDVASARMKHVLASGEIMGYGYDYCHHNRPFQIKINFSLDISPLRSEGKAISSITNSVTRADASSSMSQIRDNDEMTAKVVNSSITSTLTFLNTDYTFSNTIFPTEGVIGYFRERSVVLDY